MGKGRREFRGTVRAVCKRLEQYSLNHRHDWSRFFLSSREILCSKSIAWLTLDSASLTLQHGRKSVRHKNVWQQRGKAFYFATHFYCVLVLFYQRLVLLWIWLAERSMTVWISDLHCLSQFLALKCPDKQLNGQNGDKSCLLMLKY